MTQQFDTVISTKREELERLRTHMEQLRRQFVDETGRFLSGWFLHAARMQVEQQAEVTLRLGQGRLADMKRAVEDLSTDADKIATEALDRPGLWWHRQKLPRFDPPYLGRSEYEFEHTPPRQINDAIDRAFDRLRNVIGVRGYLKPKPTFGEGRGPHYVYELQLSAVDSIRWPEEMKSTLHRYGEAVDQGTELLREIDDVERQKRQHQASSMWDSL
jgi:hypothetical protein